MQDKGKAKGEGKWRLRGGPFDGVEVDATPGGSFIVEMPDDPSMVARYRWHRGWLAFTFREYDRVIGRIPQPEDECP